MRPSAPDGTLPENPLDRIPLSDSERLRAEAALLRGEYLADLMLMAISALRDLGRQLAHRPKAPPPLKPAG